MNEPLRDASGAVEDTSTRNRILVATAEVLARSGQTKLSLSEVALQAGVSRPTLYRWFASKQELLDAFGVYRTRDVRHRHQPGDGGPTWHGETRRRAAVHRRSTSSPTPGVRLVDIEPEVVIAQLGQSHAGHAGAPAEAAAGPNGAVKAATAIRVAISHYIVRSDDDDQFLAQLRHAAGIKHRTFA